MPEPRAADASGAKLLLVGDDAQLSAADTGGAFRLIAKDTEAAELTDVWRFTNPWERDASLALRAGNRAAIDAYDDHDRLTAGSSDQMEDAAYKAWLADTNTGKASLLIAADNMTVARLNARARLDRIITGEVEPDGIELHNGNHVGLGDHIVTRLNNRRLAYGSRQFVKNGDSWTVIQRWSDGSLTVQNHTGETVTLPGAYVQESVELAYATTAHRAQGTTVDTAHLLVTEQLTRALMYVGMTRGRDTNTAYVATHQSWSDLHEPHPEQTMQDVLEAVLNVPGVEQSAHEVMRRELDNATRLDRLIPIYEHLCQLDARNRCNAAAATSGLSSADQAALEASSAYGALVAELRRAEAIGLNATETVHQAVNQSRLSDANDLAAVLHTRVERLVTRSLNRPDQQPILLAGLVAPATNVTDPTLIAPLHELEAPNHRSRKPPGLAGSQRIHALVPGPRPPRVPIYRGLRFPRPRRCQLPRAVQHPRDRNPRKPAVRRRGAATENLRSPRQAHSQGGNQSARQAAAICTCCPCRHRSDLLMPDTRQNQPMSVTQRPRSTLPSPAEHRTSLCTVAVAIGFTFALTEVASRVERLRHERPDHEVGHTPTSRRCRPQ
ncbi:ATP-dependent RecD-like DNA helicase [Kribbella sp. NPDC004875]|uniref:ATP-dependent DNA helicase n=1 Tax=Kribbella sp. NPDC004875 TaxID=3364107 RepID=UPI0036CFD582